MAKRFEAEFRDTDGDYFRLNIFDDAYAGSDVEATLTVARPGFELVYESEPDQPFQGIISSSLTAYLVNEGGSFNTWLSNIPNVSENDVTITLERTTSTSIPYSLEWAGVVMIDQLEQLDAPTPTPVQIVANDGLSFLKTLRGDITETNENSVDVLNGNNIINWLQEILTNTKPSVHWGANDKFLRAWTDFKPDGWGTLNLTSTLNILEYASAYGAYDPNTVNVLDGTPEPYTDWTFLQSLCMLFNARLCLANGEWHFWPVNQHIMESEGTQYTYLHRVYTRSGALLTESQGEKGEFYTRTTPQLGPGTTANRYTPLAGGTISHTVPRKSFRRARPYRGQEWLNNSIRIGGASALYISTNGANLVDFHAPQSFFTGAKFRLEGNVLVARNGQGGYSGPANNAQLRLKFNMDVGQYRLDPSNNTWTTDQSTDQYLFMGNLGTISAGFDANLPVDYTTPPLPADSETMDCVIDADFINGVGSSLNSLFAGTSPQTTLGCFLTTYFVNNAYQNLLVFQGETSLDHTEPFDQGQLVFGTVDDLGTNQGQLITQNLAMGTLIEWDMGTWISSQSTTGEHINRLCVREAIALMQVALEKREGQLKIGSGMRIPSPLMTIENEDGTGYYMVTSCSYTADDRLASVTRLRVNALTFTNVTDNGDTGDPSDDTGGDGSGSGGGGGATDDDGTGGGSAGSPGGGIQNNTHLSNQLGQHIVFDKDGIVKFSPKSGEKPLTADEVDDTSTTNKFSSQAEKDDITDLKAAVKTTTGSGGKGVFVNTGKSQQASHVAVDATTAKMQAGVNTALDMSETSPGTISLKVQAGGSGSQVSVEGMRVEGHGSFQNATVTFPQPVTFGSTTSGISSSNVTEGSKLFYTNARADARIAAASVTDLTDITSAGSGDIITSAERTKLSGIATGAEVNVVTTNLGTGDQTLSAARIVNTNGNDLTFKDGTSILLQYDDSADEWAFYKPVQFRSNSGYTAGEIRLKEYPIASGDEHIALRAPNSLNASQTYVLPATDGTSGQVLQTDGSGNLSFATVSGGGGGSSFSYMTLQSSFYTGDGNGDYIPLGGTLTETTSWQYYNQWSAPLAGEVVEARIFCTGSGAGASNLHFRKYASSTNLDTASATFTTSNQLRTFTFDNATFSAGDRCAFFFDPTGVPAGVSVTILIKLTHP